tara:strand:- start:140 stop:670 length:531 start_codon:yes stop_codon:yes gene_type:complete
VTILLISLFALDKESKAIILDNKTPKVGEQSPPFILPGSNNTDKIKENWSLNDFRGTWLIVYFYPRDFTNGCTIEARNFNKLLPYFAENNAKIVGISADTVLDHNSFCTSEELDFPLLSDISGDTSKRYGSWEKPFSARNTFLIDPSGVIRYKWISVRPYKHGNEVLSTLITLQKS